MARIKTPSPNDGFRKTHIEDRPRNRPLSTARDQINSPNLRLSTTIRALSGSSKAGTKAIRDDAFEYTRDLSAHRPGQFKALPKVLDPLERGGRQLSNQPITESWLKAWTDFPDGELLFNLTRSKVDTGKIWKYVLCSNSVDGGPKAQLMSSIGFLTQPKGTPYGAEMQDSQFRSDGLFLLTQIRDGLTRFPCRYNGPDIKNKGIRCTVDMLIRSPTGNIVWLETMWFYDRIDPEKGQGLVEPYPRLTTLVPHNTKETLKFMRKKFPHLSPQVEDLPGALP